MSILGAIGAPLRLSGRHHWRGAPSIPDQRCLRTSVWSQMEKSELVVKIKRLVPERRSQKGGYRAYTGRFEKDRRPRQSRHSLRQPGSPRAAARRNEGREAPRTSPYFSGNPALRRSSRYLCFIGSFIAQQDAVAIENGPVLSQSRTTPGPLPTGRVARRSQPPYPVTLSRCPSSFPAPPHTGRRSKRSSQEFGLRNIARAALCS